MKQFTIGVIFFLSLVAQSRAERQCGSNFSWYYANVDKCNELIGDNINNHALAPVSGAKAFLSKDHNNCFIYTRSSSISRSDLARQGQEIVNNCLEGRSVTGKVTGSSPNPICLLSKGGYVIFLLFYWFG